MIREASGTPARVFARFGAHNYSQNTFASYLYRLIEQGVEKKVELDNLSSSEVASKISQLLGTTAWMDGSLRPVEEGRNLIICLCDYWLWDIL